MTSRQKAQVIAAETIKFLASKHGVTEYAMVKELSGGNIKLRKQAAELIAAAIIETA